MKIKKLLFTILLLLNSLALCGQTISGSVTDAVSGSPIGYVSIGIPDTPRGSVCGSEGNYALSVNDINKNNTIQFSCIGYETYELTVREALSKEGGCNIALTPINHTMEEVVITPLHTKTKRLGNNFKSAQMKAVAKASTRGFEFGVIIKVKKRAFLERVEVNVSECTYNDMIFRLNIYNINEDGTYTNLLRLPIYAHVERTDQTTTVKVELSEYGIVAQSNILVSFEHIEEQESGTISFPIGLTGSRSLLRKNVASEWEGLELNCKFPISVIAQVEQ